MDFLGLESTSLRNTLRGLSNPCVRTDCLFLFLPIFRFLLLSINHAHPCMEPRPQLWIFDHGMGGTVLDKVGIYGYVKGPSMHGSREIDKIGVFCKVFKLAKESSLLHIPPYNRA